MSIAKIYPILIDVATLLKTREPDVPLILKLVDRNWCGSSVDYYRRFASGGGSELAHGPATRL